MLWTSFHPLRNDYRDEGSNAPPWGQPTRPLVAVKESTGVRQELDARIQALEAMVQRNINASGGLGERPPKVKMVEVPTTPLVEGTEGMSEEESQADDDSTEINLLGSY